MINLKILKRTLFKNAFYSNVNMNMKNFSIYSQYNKFFSMSLNPFNKTKGKNIGLTSRLNELQNKFEKNKANQNKKIDIDEDDENVKASREAYAQKSFDRFVRFLENKDKFTWQNNLELIKVNN